MRKELSYADFQKLISKKKNVVLSNYILDYPIQIEGATTQSIEITNCDFKQEVTLTDLNLINLTIISCKFSYNLYLINVTHELKGDRFKNANISHCIISNLLLENCSFISFELKHNDIKQFSHHDSIISFKADYVKNTINNFLIYIKKCTDITIGNNNFNEAAILFYGTKKEEDGPPINMGQPTAHTIRLLNNKIDEQLQIFHIKTKNEITTNDIMFLDITFNPKSTGKLDIANIRVEQLLLQGTNSSNNIKFSNCELNELKLIGLTNASTIEFDNIYPHFKSILEKDNLKSGLLKIQNSILGKVYFKNVNLSIFTKVEISESSISEIIPINITWFNYNTLESIIHSNRKKDKSPIERYRQIRDVFKQLKIVAEKSSEKQAYLNFRAKEFTYFYKELKLTKPWHDRDRIVLWMNKSNSYGVNWIKPILLNLGIALVVFCVIVSIIGCYNSISFSKAFLLYIDDIPSLLNPARDLSKIFPKEDLTFTINLIDYIHRAILSYLIFQTIIAFRKFSQ